MAFDYALEINKTLEVGTVKTELTFNGKGEQLKSVSEDSATGNKLVSEKITNEEAGAQAQAVAADAALTLNGSGVVGGVITNETEKNVTINSAGDDTGVKFVIVGTDAAGNALSETVTGANAGTVKSTAVFKTITSVTAQGDPAAEVSVGDPTYKLKTTETFKETVGGTEVTSTRESLMEYSEDDKVIKGEQTLNGEKTEYGAENADGSSNIKAVTMDKTSLTELSDTAGVVKVFDDVASDAKVYSKTATIGEGIESISYFDDDGIPLGSEDTTTQKFGDTTYTNTNYLDADGNIIGSSGGDGTNTYESFKAVNKDGVAAAADVADGGILTLTGATGGVVTHAVAQMVTIHSAGNDSEISFIVVGTDAEGADLTEEVVGSNAGTATSAGSFKTIKSITAKGDPVGKVSVGDGTTKETGLETSKVGDDTEARSFEYVYNSDGTLKSGSDTQGKLGSDNAVVGEKVTYGAQNLDGSWAIDKVELDASLLGDALNADNLAKALNLGGVPSALVAASGATYSEVETYEGGGGQTTYLDANGVTLGTAYSYVDTEGGYKNITFEDANGNYVGSTSSDADGRVSWDKTTRDADGNVTAEEGLYSEGDGGEAYSYSWTYGADGKMDEGEEVSGKMTDGVVVGTTYAYGAEKEDGSRNLTSTKANVSGLQELDLNAIDQNIKNAFFLEQSKVLIAVEKQEWGGELRTFLDANGGILGYADKYEWTEGDQTNIGITYMDSNWNFVGHEWDDQFGGGYTFYSNKDADGKALDANQEREFGTHYYGDGQGGQEGRSFDFTFTTNATTGERTKSGTEETGAYDGGDNVADADVISGGVTTTYVAGKVTAQKADLTGAKDLTLTDLPDGVATALFGSVTAIKYTEQDYGDWKDITYYNSDGKILGYSNEGSWESGDMSGTNSGYMDNDWNWIGGEWSETEGGVTRSGSNVYSEIVNGSGVQTGFVESGSYRDGDEGSTYTFTYDVTLDSNGYIATETMQSGKEVRGKYQTEDNVETLVGTTYTYGVQESDGSWNLTGTKANLTGAKVLTMSDIHIAKADGTKDDTIVEAMFGKTPGEIKYVEESNEWNPDSTQTTYYDAAGAIVGYADSHSDDYGSGTFYMDANYNWVGDTWNNDWGSGFSVELKTFDGDGKAIVKRVGENTWLEGDQKETNSYTETFDTSGKYLEGTEINSFGETIEYGEDRVTLKVSRKIDTSASNMAELTDAQLAELPAALKAAVGKTYAEKNVNPWGTEYTYLDSDGQILGYAHEWSDQYGSGKSFNDADYQHLGSYFEDNWSKGFHHTSEILSDGVVIGYREKGERTEKADGDADGEYTGEVSKTDFIYDINWNMLSGTEQRGATKLTYSSGNWSNPVRETDTSNLDTVNVTGLDASVQTALFGTGVADKTKVNAIVENFDWGGSFTTYFADTTAGGGLLGYADTWDDQWGKGQSFRDANDKQIGHINTDEFGNSSSFFTVDNGDGTRTETGSNTWGYDENNNGIIEDSEKTTTKFSFTYYNTDNKMKKGTETNSDGTEIEYGEDGKFLGAKVETSGLDTLSDAQFADDGIPAAFKGTAASDTYLQVQNWGGGNSETTFLDANGKILGFMNTWSDGDFGGTDFHDANREHLGGSWSDPYGSGSFVRNINTDGSAVETGTNTWKENIDGVETTMTSSFTYNFAAPEFEGAERLMTGGKETRPDKTEVTLGENWSFVGEKISVDDLPPISQEDFAALALFPSLQGASASKTFAVVEIHNNDQGVSTGMPGGGGKSSFTTYLDDGGNVLGYKDSWEDPYGKGSSFQDASRVWLGGSSEDDYMKSSQSSQDTMEGAVKVGTTETRTEAFKNDGDGKGVYSGDERTVVSKYDLNGYFLGAVETIQLSDTEKREFILDKDFQITAEYGYKRDSVDDDYIKTITDPYALFQLQEWNLVDDYMEAFAGASGITNFVDSDGNGEVDAFENDGDGDGVSDLIGNFGEAILDATVFSMSGPPTVQQADGKISGFTIKANGYELQLSGKFVKAEYTTAEQAKIDDALSAFNKVADGDSPGDAGFTEAKEEFLIDRGVISEPQNDTDMPTVIAAADRVDMDGLTGQINSAIVYDVANSTYESGVMTKKAVIGFSETLDITWSDLNSFMSGRPDGDRDEGPPSGGPKVGQNVVSLTDLMGNQFGDIEAPMGAPGIAAAGAGAKVSTDASGVQTMVSENDFGDITTAIVNGNSTIQTIEMADGTVRKTEFVYDPASGLSREVDLGTGRVDTNESGQEVQTLQREAEVVDIFGQTQKVSYDVTTTTAKNGAKTEIVIGSDNTRTETTEDARGDTIVRSQNADFSVTETKTSVDGKTVETREIDQFGALTVRQTVFDAEGNDTTKIIGTGTASQVDGHWTEDLTDADTGIRYVRNIGRDGSESVDAFDGEEFLYNEKEEMQADGTLRTTTVEASGKETVQDAKILENGQIQQTKKVNGQDAGSTDIVLDKDGNKTEVVIDYRDNGDIVTTTFNFDGTRSEVHVEPDGDVLYRDVDKAGKSVETYHKDNGDVYVQSFEAGATNGTIIATGTKTKGADDSVIILLDKLDANGAKIGQEEIVTDKAGEVTRKDKDKDGNDTASTEKFKQLDGTETEIVSDILAGTVTETIETPEGSTIVIVTTVSSGAIKSTETTKDGQKIIKEGKVTVDATTKAETKTYDLGGGNIEKVVTTFNTDGSRDAEVKEEYNTSTPTNITKTTIETDGNGDLVRKFEDAAGNETKETTNSKGVTQKIETKVSVDEDGATVRDVTVSESGVNADGTLFNNSLATGKASVVDGKTIMDLVGADQEVIKIVEKADGSSDIEVTDRQGNIQKLGLDAEGKTTTQTIENKDGTAIKAGEFDGGAVIGRGDEDDDVVNTPNAVTEQTQPGYSPPQSGANCVGWHAEVDDVFVSFDIV